MFITNKLKSFKLKKKITICLYETTENRFETYITQIPLTYSLLYLKNDKMYELKSLNTGSTYSLAV